MITPCTICGKPSIARALCRRHYRAFMAYGDPLETKNLRGVSFSHRYTVDTQTGCWCWIGGTDQCGYGCWAAYGETRAHRASYILHRGAIPVGLHVLHTCDNPGCVNPEHLRLGTHQDNIEAQAIQIMGDARVSERIAAEYGVDRATVDNIRNGKSWSHIFDEDIKKARIAAGRNKLVDEPKIVSMGGSHTQMQIAEHFGISQSRVSTILRAYGASRGRHTAYGKGHGLGGRKPKEHSK